MLQINVQPGQVWDESTETFHTIKKSYTLNLEHSLISLALWESRWKIPFLTETPKTDAQILSYIKCMTINKNVPDDVYYCLTRDDLLTINAYLEDTMTATTFSNKESGDRSQFVTNELLYYYMSELSLPIEAEKWHLNRLLTLIRVASTKKQPPKKQSEADVLRRYDELNRQRLKEWGGAG